MRYGEKKAVPTGKSVEKSKEWGKREQKNDKKSKEWGKREIGRAHV